MKNLNVTINMSSIIQQLCKNEGATVALAKALLDDDKLKIFEIESRIQTLYSLIEFVELFPEQFDNGAELIKSAESNIEQLEKERNELS